MLAGACLPACCLLQVVDEVFDRVAARKMGIDQVGQVCIMIHSGSRGLGHQVRRGLGGPWGVDLIELD